MLERDRRSHSRFNETIKNLQAKAVGLRSFTNSGVLSTPVNSVDYQRITPLKWTPRVGTHRPRVLFFDWLHTGEVPVWDGGTQLWPVVSSMSVLHMDSWSSYYKLKLKFNKSSKINKVFKAHIVYRGGSRIFFRRGCTRLLLYFNINKPHSFFLQNTSSIRKPQVISGGGGVRTPSTLPLDPPLVHECYRSLLLISLWNSFLT